MLRQEITRKKTPGHWKEQRYTPAELAVIAIKEYIINKRVISPPADVAREMKERRGVFVSLKKNGKLRGCIGTYMPARDNVAEEIIQNAISAATRDPRFRPVEEEELDEIDYSVDILSEYEKVNGIEDLNPKRYGVIIRSGIRKGLLLPDLDGIDTADAQIRIAKEKAGILPDESVEIFRFEVKRYR